MATEVQGELTQQEYELFRAFIHEQCGIDLGARKLPLLRARLGKKLRSGEFRSYREYYEFVKSDRSGQGLTDLIDAVSTNTTHLFREKQHFDFLDKVLSNWSDPNGRDHRPQVRIWSAGCSSGEEPYSIAMTCADVVSRGRKGDVRILATDISTRVLEKAAAAVFTRDRLAQAPANFVSRYFVRSSRSDPETFRPNEAIRGMIKFERFNLMTARFPFQHGFDVIFCRNVMIYFDRPTVEGLVRRFAGVLRPGGYLLIGHSESLNNLSHPLQYVMPTVYQKA